MKTTTWMWIAFATMAAAQWSVPAWMIASQEIALNRGVEYRFQCAPVDPYDLFRGRYVSIQLRENLVSVPEEAEFRFNQRAYASLTVGEEGYARIHMLHEAPPENVDWIPVRVLTAYEGQRTIRFPFDRYYMNERLAPEAERAYFEGAAKENVTLALRVYRGRPVIAGLLIDDQPIEEYLKERLDEKREQ